MVTRHSEVEAVNMDMSLAKIKKEHVVPRALFRTKNGHHLALDAHMLLFGKSKSVAGYVTILTLPRKVEGVNLVRVAFGGSEYECFYSDVLKHCEFLTVTRHPEVEAGAMITVEVK